MAKRSSTGSPARHRAGHRTGVVRGTLEPMKKAAARAKGRGRPAKRDDPRPDMSAYGRLAEYNRKRHFGVTPEPPGTRAGAGGGAAARVRRPEAPRDRAPLRLPPGAPRGHALVGGPQGPVARSRREAAGDGDRAAPDGLQPVRGSDPRRRVRRRDRDDLGQGRVGADRPGPARGRGRGRPPAREGRPQVRAAGRRSSSARGSSSGRAAAGSGS